MISSELISILQGLSRPDKLYALQVIVSELAQDETELLKPDQSYPVWSPYGANEAAETMLRVLHDSQSQDHA